MKSCLAIFCKPPVPGKVKSRLALDIGARKAASVYNLMLRRAAEELSGVDSRHQIFISEPPGSAPIPWSDYTLQTGNDLGERMKNAFLLLFAEGYERVLLCGTDIPGLTAPIVTDFFLALSSNDVVIGPTTDGGYYLIGFRKNAFNSKYFESIPWSTPAVYDRTVGIGRSLDAKLYLGPSLIDLDSYDDALLISKELKGPFGDELKTYLDGGGNE